MAFLVGSVGLRFVLEGMEVRQTSFILFFWSYDVVLGWRKLPSKDGIPDATYGPLCILCPHRIDRDSYLGHTVVSTSHRQLVPRR